MHGASASLSHDVHQVTSTSRRVALACAQIKTDRAPFINQRARVLEHLETRLCPVVPAYSSLPGANHTIYLDFDGHVTQNTQWNSYFGVSTINSPAYDTDNNRYVFNWDTNGLADTCFNLVVKLLDGDSYSTIVHLTSASPTTVFNISPTPGGDFIDRGFYVTNYPSTTLVQANLYFSATIAGTYTLSLTARDGAYDGPVLGSSQATVVLDGTTTQTQSISFFFASPAIVNGSTVAFVTQLVNGPAGAGVYYAVGDCSGPNPQCDDVFETEGTTPPLDTFRRNGMGIRFLDHQ